MTTAQTLKSKTGVVGATIILKTGRYFDFLSPQPDMIHIEDIAQGLSQTARFGGQALNFYSVAQHSVLVSSIVPDELKFAALMHDAAEAYIGDIVGPLKQLLPDYKVIESRVEEAVCARFGLQLSDIKHPEIKRADLRLLRTEQRDLTSGAADEWNGLSKYPPLEQTIEPLDWLSACSEFLIEFGKLATHPSDEGGRDA